MFVSSFLTGKRKELVNISLKFKDLDEDMTQQIKEKNELLRVILELTELNKKLNVPTENQTIVETVEIMTKVKEKVNKQIEQINEEKEQRERERAKGDESEERKLC